MARSLWKGPYVHPSLLKKPPVTMKNQRGGVRATWSRNSTVIPSWVGCSLRVHNGTRFQLVRFVEDSVGHKVGEFVLTRKRAIHLKKLKSQVRKR